MMYDIIGDIHGHADELELLLDNLKYKKKGGVYEHGERKAIFVGDFINRGKKVRRTLEIVKAMVDHGTALAILGNHDYTLLQYFSRTLGFEHRPGFNLNVIAQMATTAADFRLSEKEFYQYISWLETLPFFLENDSFRVVHAAWIPKHIRRLNIRFANKCTARGVLQTVRDGDLRFQHMVTDLTEGIQVPKKHPPKPYNRDMVRLRWWEDPAGKKPEDLLVRFSSIGLEEDLSDDLTSKFYPYGQDEKPVFFGHYCLSGKHRLMTPNVCCVDFCVAKQRRLTAYRWQGEAVLDRTHFTY